MSWACSIPPPLFSATGQLSGLDVLLEELQMDDWEKTNTGCNTEYRVSTCSRCTLSISSVGCTGDYAYVSTRMQPTWSLIRHSASPGMPHSSSLTEELWLKSLLMFHAYGVESIPYPSLLWFYRLFAWGKKSIEHIKDFRPLIVRKGAALCWHSLLAKLEWFCCHRPSPSWRISVLVRLALKHFALLLSVFSLFPFNSYWSCSAIP